MQKLYFCEMKGKSNFNNSFKIESDRENLFKRN